MYHFNEYVSVLGIDNERDKEMFQIEINTLNLQFNNMLKNIDLMIYNKSQMFKNTFLKKFWYICFDIIQIVSVEEFCEKLLEYLLNKNVRFNNDYDYEMPDGDEGENGNDDVNNRNNKNNSNNKNENDDDDGSFDDSETDAVSSENDEKDNNNNNNDNKDNFDNISGEYNMDENMDFYVIEVKNTITDLKYALINLNTKKNNKFSKVNSDQFSKEIFIDCLQISNLYRSIPINIDFFLSLKLVIISMNNNVNCLLPPPPEDIVWESIQAKESLLNIVNDHKGNFL